MGCRRIFSTLNGIIVDNSRFVKRLVEKNLHFFNLSIEVNVMRFFDRYAQLCHEFGIDPCGQKAETLIGINKTTANKWNINGTTPKGDTVRLIADYFHVSTDYLLGRTEDRTDYSVQAGELTQEMKQFVDLFSRMNTETRMEILEYLKFRVAKEKGTAGESNQ